MRRLARSTPFGTTLGQEGFAANVTGGAGGTVFAVTNGNDSGAGSFRQACADADANSPAPSIIDIQYGGFITVQSTVLLNADNVTVTGRNAPSPFVIRGAIPALGGSWWDGPALDLFGSNVLLEYLRIHRGLGSPFSGGNTKNMFVFGSDTLVRHCSFAWGEDVCLAVWNGSDVTFQYCLFYEALGNAHHRESGAFQYHAMMNNLTGDSASKTVPVRSNIAHSAAAHAGERHGWRCDRPETEIVNYITYNYATGTIHGPQADIFGNCEGCMWISGANQLAGPREPINSNSPGGQQVLYVSDPLWLKPGFAEERSPANLFWNGSPKATPTIFTPITPVPITRLPVDEMWQHLRPRIGAIRPRRTRSDIRILEQIDNAVRRIAIEGEIRDSPTAADQNQNPAATTAYVANWDQVL